MTLPQQPANRPQQPALSVPQPDRQAPLVAAAPQAALLPASDSAKVVGYQKEDLTLLIRADLQLNRFQNNAHTLFMCIYQLKDPNAFNQLAEEKDGVPKLLECNRFDGSVANAKRIVVQPGQSIKESRDRAEGARFIGIAAGYFGSGKQKVTELATLSVNNGDYPGTTIGVDLGPYEIERVTVK